MTKAPLFSGASQTPNNTELASIAAILHEAAGIVITPGKGSMVQSRLAKRLRALKMTDYASYIALVRSPEGAGEKRLMISALTTNVTNFFRENHHFEQLRDTALPQLVTKARAGGRVRLWSAGCSNGQEAYSMAMVLADLLPDVDKYDVRILATDIDPVMIKRGRDAVYEPSRLDAIPSNLRHRFIETHAQGARVAECLRNLVSFQELNLHAPWPIRGQFDVIFCRNVVIYFDQPAQNALWRRFEEALQPGGWLFVGHSERVPLNTGSRLVTAGITSYRLPGATPKSRERTWH